MKDIQTARELVAKWAKTFTRVSPALVMAIIGNESRFNATAKNLTGGDLARGGAWGYMQMTLKTALGLVDSYPTIRNLGVVKTWERDGIGLLNPDRNIAMGMFYLDTLARGLGDAAKANPYLVVAAYNRGLGAVKAMLAKGVDVTSLDYVRHVIAMKDQLAQNGVTA